jgi:hypothetical protein
MAKTMQVLGPYLSSTSNLGFAYSGIVFSSCLLSLIIICIVTSYVLAPVETWCSFLDLNPLPSSVVNSVGQFEANELMQTLSVSL